MENKGNLTRIINSSHENKWVAISRTYNKVIDFADSLTDLDKKIKNPKEVIYTRILAKNVSFAPAGL